MIRWIKRIVGAIGLLLYFHYDLVISTFAVIWDILTPTLRARPDVIKVPLRGTRDWELMLTANLVSLTPGSLSLDLEWDESGTAYLVVHGMFAADDPEGVRNSVLAMEARVLRMSQ